MNNGIPVKVLVKRNNDVGRKSSGSHYVFAGLYIVAVSELVGSAKTTQKITQFIFRPYKWDNPSLEVSHKVCLQARIERLIKFLHDAEDLFEWEEAAVKFVQFLQGQIYRRYPLIVDNQIATMRKLLKSKRRKLHQEALVDV